MPKPPKTTKQDTPGIVETVFKDKAKKTVVDAISKSETVLNQYFTKYTKYYQLYRGFQSNKSFIAILFRSS